MIEEIQKMLGAEAADVRRYVAQRLLHLASLSEEEFRQALPIERDNVLIQAGLAAVDAADEVDAELRGIILGALGLGARILSA